MFLSSQDTQFRFSSSNAATTSAFKAETRQLLDIVTNSIYTDKEVFLRELVSNASDACEKLRHLRAVNHGSLVNSSDVDLTIDIAVDEEAKTITISDTGVGLTPEEMSENLGTIAKSGSRAFSADNADAQADIIGKFGVGFYSAFMVGEKVTVSSKSATASGDVAAVWSSDGGGEFSIEEGVEDDSIQRGSKITIHLKESEASFASKSRVSEILKKYSGFVSFPVSLNGEKVNTMDAVWTLEPNKVDDETHDAFYKFVAGAFDSPLYRLHYRADAPLEIKTLLYVPTYHTEKYGMGRMNPGVSLYSRKVLIEKDSPDILPDWLRFVKGVVDSEDLPLAISREKAQDSRLIAKLKSALTRRFISELTKFAKKDPEKYKKEFFTEFGHFLKEGVCQDFAFQSQLSKLLYFESSKTESGELTSLDEYVGRCTPEQKSIYYLCAPNRELALASPYFEAFKEKNVEVLLVYSPIDDFVMSNLAKFEDRDLVTAEKDGLKVEGEEGEKDAEEDKPEGGEELCAWLQVALGDKVSTVRTTTRLKSSPAIVVDHESGALRRMMKMVDTQGGATGNMALPKQVLEVNASHPIMKMLWEMKESGDDDVAKKVMEQVFDNALVTAGLMDDSRAMVPRINELLELVLEAKSAK